ncbi:MAG: hypothetical protein C4527_08630 [Candidatus Omnitrophota bacterium]|jgi:hypothetical protein|nr:MAG: hypothetical protein C4527_08630 [Candidatus Omnitrophota bacterium]
MKNRNENESPVDALIENTLTDDIPPNIRQDLYNQINRFMNGINSEKRPSWTHFREWFAFPRLAWVGSASVVSVIVFVFALLTFDTPGNHAYARVLEALKKVRTVHVTGWTKFPSYSHSTVQDEPLDHSMQYDLDTWEWITKDDHYRFYDRQGPFIRWDDGDRRYEYHEPYDRLYVSESKPRPVGVKFEKIGERLENLNERGTKKTSLGEQILNGRLAKGMRLERSEQKYAEYWLDAETNLPIRSKVFRWREDGWEQTWELTVTYDEEVPDSIVNDEPPKAKEVLYDSTIDPQFEKWRQRLRELAARYQQKPLPERMELIPRESTDQMDAYSFGKLPGIESHVVEPIQTSLCFYLRRIAWNCIPPGFLRVSEECKEIELNHDLIMNIELARPSGQRERLAFVLDSLGLELVEIREERTIWIAHYDGRPLKPWQEVKAPVIQEITKPLVPGVASGRGTYSLEFLFGSFAYWQDDDLTAKDIVIVDKTGIPSGQRPDGSSDESTAVSSESPYWGGKQSIDLARKWFEQEFGITFTDEIQPMNIFVIRKKGL